MRKVRKIMACTLAASLMIASVATANDANAKAKKPKLSTSKATITVGKTKKITVKKAKPKKTTWTVNKKGKKIVKLTKKKKTSVTIKALKKGRATVTAKIKVGKKNYTKKVKVTVKGKTTPTKSASPSNAPASNAPVSAAPASKAPSKTTIKLDKTKLTVPYNASLPLVATVTPESEAANVVWTSSNENVATVKDGMVKGVEKGTATITATVNGVSATCAVTVTKEEFGTIVMDANFDDGKIAPWGPRAATNDPTATIGEDGYEGKCLKITDRGSNPEGALLDLSDWVEPSATYEFSCYVKLASDAPSNSAILLSTQTKAVANGDEIYANVKCVVSQKSYWGCSADYIIKDPREWQQVTYTVTTPDDVARFGLYFECGNCANADLFVDNSTLKLVSRNVPDYTLPSLYETYKDIFPNMGVAVDYNQLMGENTMKFIKAQYNSVTMGNAMKPDAILPAKNDDMLSVDEAKAAGYYVTEEYQNQAFNKKNGAVVYPKLRFDTVDALLKRAHDSGVKMRFHALLWHQQMPVYFFKAGYLSAVTGRNASTDAMDTRVEWYVRTVMDHVMKSEYADVIYAIDVVNEYFHSHNCSNSSVNGNGVTFWEDIYNTNEAGSKMITNPSYVKLGFQCAYDVVKNQYKRDDISLIYNDYNTYGEDTADRIVTMYNWLNTKDEVNTTGAKICDGVGMQTHLSYGQTYHSATAYKAALDKFRAAGMEIQVTEWDATNFAGATEEQFAQYWVDIMQALIDTKKAGGNVTGITIWGLYDATSWRADGTPLIFTGLFNKKLAFDKLIELGNNQ